MSNINNHINGKINFHVFGNLKDFLTKNSNGHITFSFTKVVSLKYALEAIGIPHVEVGQLIKEHIHLPFSYRLCNGDIIEVHPQPAFINGNETLLLRPPVKFPIQFILDVHLGSLARLLRLTGFDTFYEKNLDDTKIARMAASESRIVLTRDIGLLKHKIIDWGYWIRSQRTEEQFHEVANRFNLWPYFAPFTFCLACNGKILPVIKDSIADMIPADAFRYFQSFYQCKSCLRIYWKGSHYEKMLITLERLKRLNTV